MFLRTYLVIFNLVIIYVCRCELFHRDNFNYSEIIVIFSPHVNHHHATIRYIISYHNWFSDAENKKRNNFFLIFQWENFFSEFWFTYSLIFQSKIMKLLNSTIKIPRSVFHKWDSEPNYNKQRLSRSPLNLNKGYD